MKIHFSHILTLFQGFQGFGYGESTIFKGPQKIQGFQGIFSRVGKIQGCFKGFKGFKVFWPP